ncbi:twin-arginine translocase TatA/TatE family subunit [Paenibacillus eucommiae]|uniref:Tat protein translocase TatB subunit n=1 Tax=Paenibacillus eucommiae TaxID=1355755 RepID=A0ABS4J579_9BACL|nr:twin-arginine translocase TatA/TatE family subunit [Paenibacillus eucommiae]MBP1994988.1 Tat protein translocase TatB subunit [Paenibacillus eucommiae]
MMLQNVGFSEIVLLVIIALVLFGPQKLPEIARTVGKTLAELKKGAREIVENVKMEPPQEMIKQAMQSNPPAPQKKEVTVELVKEDLIKEDSIKEDSAKEEQLLPDSSVPQEAVTTQVQPQRERERRLPD